jgi:hypothetical protein
MLVDPPFSPAHRTGRDHSDELITDGKHDEQEPAGVRVTQRIISRGGLGALLPCDDHQRTVKEHLLRLAPGYVVCNPVLFRVAVIPLKTSAL